MRDNVFIKYLLSDKLLNEFDKLALTSKKRALK